MEKKQKQLLAAALLGVLAIGIYAAWPGWWWPLAKAFNPDPSISPLSAEETKDWNTYSDPVFNFRFKYPNGYEVVDNSARPVMVGAAREIAVKNSADSKSPDLFFAIDLFDDAFIGLGGIDFSLNGETESIGCAYGSGCRIYSEKNNAVISVKPSPYPWQMIDPAAKKILATVIFLKPAGGGNPQ
jgi:hypothetical protein